ncbi:MAG: hypothetical protein JNN13_07960 [Planctomycetes bacterium]|nr:hypothetical protein [Planctomycetota bacterium]
MHASNTAQGPGSGGLKQQADPQAAVVSALWEGAIGRTVRCVPTRRTVQAAGPAGVVYGKWRLGHRADAEAEWRWLHLLPLLGIPCPKPVAFVGHGRRTLLVTAALPGRALDAWAVDAAREGWLDQLVTFGIREVAPLVRRLHAHGVVFRDLYWNHVFAGDPRHGGPVALLDVERVFRPRWCWRRWVVKDLAGLRASLPVAVGVRSQLRFLAASLQRPLRDLRPWIRAILVKSERVQRHRPRFG